MLKMVQIPLSSDQPLEWLRHAHGRNEGGEGVNKLFFEISKFLQVNILSGFDQISEFNP